MKKVTIISSSPREKGNSNALAEEFARGAKDAGNSVEIINLRDFNLHYCLACYGCENTGRCIHDDGMWEIAEKLLASDVIVFATPVYFYSMSGQLKVFIDRLMPYYQKIRSDIYIIASQWDTDKVIMENTVNAIRGCTKECFEHCEEKGVIYGVGLYEKGDAEKNTEIMNEAYSMGYGV